MFVISYQLPTTHIEEERMQHNGCLSGAEITFPSRAPGLTNGYCGVSVAQSLAVNVLQIITCSFVLCVFTFLLSIHRFSTLVILLVSSNFAKSAMSFLMMDLYQPKVTVKVLIKYKEVQKQGNRCSKRKNIYPSNGSTFSHKGRYFCLKTSYE